MNGRCGVAIIRNPDRDSNGQPRVNFAFRLISFLLLREYQRSMFQLRAGSQALVIGAQTANGRCNIGKAVELFGLFQPGERFLNPVNGVITEMPRNVGRALWLVTGNVTAFDGQQGFAFIRAEHLMPLQPDSESQDLRERVID
ncbi:hypothetical protein SAMN03159428_03178 [Kosakonia radicincitans]|uniref:PilZ domain-containing protein n=2 Tax=Enterobacteriaceae TaxID=543 RepID=A0AAX2EVU5_9ENTR|nr:hypothetical protein SAMN03159468_03923 [Kosakonia radicincitans]SFR21959.1 hypothetical protein SAMN03159514_03717 [Kosakonia radicincitans]SFT98458.1 hypothetical protein SAMN03159428_03178 [Kosakonia radicincitans]SFY13555.1 hypothetical protein SAMN03159436_03908 [Kosakonia radicincitans]